MDGEDNIDGIKTQVAFKLKANLENSVFVCVWQLSQDQSSLPSGKKILDTPLPHKLTNIYLDSGALGW